MRHVIFSWPTASEFLLARLIPDARRVRAAPVQDVDKIVQRVPRGATFWFHVDLTITAGFPRDRLRLTAALRAKGVRLINAEAVDISKRTLQARLSASGMPNVIAHRVGPPDELLIVKTNANFGADSERRVPTDARGGLRICDPHPAIGSPHLYPVLPRHDIPGEFWVNPALVVERFVSNGRDRIWRAYFVGRTTVMTEALIPGAIKKMGERVDRHNHLVSPDGLPPAPRFGPARTDLLMETFVGAATALGIEFGTADIVEDRVGRFYVVDVNTTPWWGRESQPEMIEHLRASDLLRLPDVPRNGRRLGSAVSLR